MQSALQARCRALLARRKRPRSQCKTATAQNKRRCVRSSSSFEAGPARLHHSPQHPSSFGEALWSPSTRAPSECASAAVRDTSVSPVVVHAPSQPATDARSQAPTDAPSLLELEHKLEELERVRLDQDNELQQSVAVTAAEVQSLEMDVEQVSREVQRLQGMEAEVSKVNSTCRQLEQQLQSQKLQNRKLRHAIARHQDCDATSVVSGASGVSKVSAATAPTGWLDTRADSRPLAGFMTGDRQRCASVPLSSTAPRSSSVQQQLEFTPQSFPLRSASVPESVASVWSSASAPVATYPVHRHAQHLGRCRLLHQAPSRAAAAANKAAYAAYLKQQMQDAEERKRKAKAQERTETGEFFPFGQPGGGAALRDFKGDVVANVSWTRDVWYDQALKQRNAAQVAETRDFSL